MSDICQIVELEFIAACEDSGNAAEMTAIRNARLNACYSIPGYEDMTPQEQQAIYDRVAEMIL